MDLYVVYLGGNLSPGRLGEDHEVVLVVAETPKEARDKARAKWGGFAAEGTRAHVDALARVRAVDGYDVALSWSGAPDDIDTRREYVP